MSNRFKALVEDTANDLVLFDFSIPDTDSLIYLILFSPTFTNPFL